MTDVSTSIEIEYNPKIKINLNEKLKYTDTFLISEFFTFCIAKEICFYCSVANGVVTFEGRHKDNAESNDKLPKFPALY